MSSPRAVAVSTPSDTQILLTRAFLAPRAHLWRAWTTPALVRRWWAAGRGEVTAIDIDLRPGGTWRYAIIMDDGSQAAFHGEYHEVVPETRLVYTEVFDDRPQVTALTTVSFADTGEGTAVSLLVSYDRPEDRDEHLRYMADGLEDAMDLLEQVTMAEGGR